MKRTQIRKPRPGKGAATKWVNRKAVTRHGNTYIKYRVWTHANPEHCRDYLALVLGEGLIDLREPAFVPQILNYAENNNKETPTG